jgi:hypothetical protein
MEVHAKIDPIWQNSGLSGKARRGKRAAVYGWMAAILGIKTYHTAEMTAADCGRALELIKQYPYADYRAQTKESGR